MYADMHAYFRMSRSELRARTKSHLRRAAQQEFALRGVGASIDRISEAAGFSRGAFYSNYSGKHEVLLELLEEHQTREIEAWQSLIESDGQIEDILPILKKRFYAFAVNDDAFMFDFELRTEAMRNQAISEQYASFVNTIRERTDELAAAMIRRAGATGTSADLLSTALRSFCSQILEESRFGLLTTEETPGSRLVKLVSELLGIGRVSPAP